MKDTLTLTRDVANEWLRGNQKPEFLIIKKLWPDFHVSETESNFLVDTSQDDATLLDLGFGKSKEQIIRALETYFSSKPMKAVLVDFIFTTRVVVPLEASPDQVYQAAANNMRDRLNADINFELLGNAEGITLDTESPYLAGEEKLNGFGFYPTIESIKK